MGSGSEHTVTWNGYLIHRVCESHYKDLIEISKSAFNITTTLEYYRSKNNTSNFNGISNLGFIAYSESGEPAAFYGVFACQAELEGKIVPVAQSGDTMTHKNHMGKGLFTQLALLTYELCKSKGIAFVFGFPNNNSYPGFAKKLNWQFPGRLNEYRIKVTTLPLVKLVKKIPLLKFFYQPYLKFITSFYKSNEIKFDSSVIVNGVGGIHRSKEYLEYKKQISGSYFISINEADLWVKPEGFLFIGDIKMKSANFNLLLGGLKRYAFLIGADVIIFHTTEGTSLDLSFSDFVTPSEGLPWGYCDFNTGIDPSKIRYVTADIDIF